MNKTGFAGFQAVNVLAVVLTVSFNVLANALPLNGVFTGTVSDSYPNLFTPPGYVFSIWGAIYFLVCSFMIYQARGSQRNADYLGRIGGLYLLAAALNVAWLFAFHYSYGNPSIFVFTPLPIAALLLTLILTYVRLGVGKREVPLGQKLAVHLPVSVYLGWISLATIANVASVINVFFPGIPAGAQAAWTAATILMALAVALLMLARRKDLAYSPVVAARLLRGRAQGSPPNGTRSPLYTWLRCRPWR
ncbi:MAG: hypothetical protein QXF24_00525 [Thermoproteota archaeon]